MCSTPADAGRRQRRDLHALRAPRRQGWLTERSEEEIEYGGGTVRALRLCFESEAGGETIQCTLWFGADDAPLRAEIAEKNEKLPPYCQLRALLFVIQ